MIENVRNGMLPGLAGRFGVAGLVLGTALSLGGCESSARQDPYTKPTGTCSFMAPTVSGARTYAPKGAAPDSAIAYPDPETPIYCDRPISESLMAAIELADYRKALQDADLFRLLQRNGPFTVFAIPNSPLEHYSTQFPGGILAPANAPALKALLSYTIVEGNWPAVKIAQEIAHSPNGAFALPTIGGASIVATVEASSGQIVLSNGAGVVTRLWVTGAPQSNGTLYFVQSLLPPPAVHSTPASAPAGRR
ncbi:fasciclin domain-containing protein [Acetobacter sacchari]|uniref:Fasciclin domain-containing protein n=1 Tax=Acetobacter sacchari TaxID=2661687 RepID=A0ABS3LUS1_9PROT|nr:fasciclin domain-containing protein [Acetobacter sacchari]MBO1359663.1 fasciclin domain-containing protein [Acetobacter sacchari]